MLNSTLFLSNRCLFLDFFCIEYRWYKKHEPLPKDFFLENTITKSIKTELGQSKLCFVDNKVFICKETSPQTLKPLIAPNTNIIALVNTINYKTRHLESQIIRNASPIENLFSGLSFVNFKSISPYGFSINNINEDASFEFNFPNRYHETILRDDTFCFHCKKLPRLDGEWFTPGILLMMFVKNYGFFDQIELVPKERLSRMINYNNLPSNEVKLRNFKKSSLLFEF